MLQFLLQGFCKSRTMLITLIVSTTVLLVHDHNHKTSLKRYCAIQFSADFTLAAACALMILIAAQRSG